MDNTHTHSKKVTWANDEQLVKLKEIPNRFDPESGCTIRTKSSSKEPSQDELGRDAWKREMKVQIKWRKPKRAQPPIGQTPEQASFRRGGRSREAAIQRERESGILEIVYPRENLIPLSPAEPASHATEVPAEQVPRFPFEKGAPMPAQLQSISATLSSLSSLTGILGTSSSLATGLQPSPSHSSGPASTIPASAPSPTGATPNLVSALLQNPNMLSSILGGSVPSSAPVPSPVTIPHNSSSSSSSSSYDSRYNAPSSHSPSAYSHPPVHTYGSNPSSSSSSSYGASSSSYGSSSSSYGRSPTNGYSSHGGSNGYKSVTNPAYSTYNTHAPPPRNSYCNGAPAAHNNGYSSSHGHGHTPPSSHSPHSGSNPQSFRKHCVHYHSPHGCRNSDRCTFIHDRSHVVTEQERSSLKRPMRR